MLFVRDQNIMHSIFYIAQKNVLEKESTLMEQMFSLKSCPPFRREANIKLKELLPIKVCPFTYNYVYAANYITQFRVHRVCAN